MFSYKETRCNINRQYAHFFPLSTYHFDITRILLTEDISNWYSTAAYYAKCDVISRQKATKQNIQTEISRQQSVAAHKYKRTCIAVLNTLSHHAIKTFVSWAL